MLSSNPMPPQQPPPRIAPAISIVVVAQAIKFAHYTKQLPEDEASTTFLILWLVLDIVLCVSIFLPPFFGLQKLRLWAAIAVLLTQSINLVLHQSLVAAERIDFTEPHGPHDSETTTPHKTPSWSLFNLFRSGPDVNDDPRLLGKHIIRVSASNTAKMNPEGISFCISQADGPIFIPILLDNVRLAGLRYSLGDVGNAHDGAYNKVDTIDLTPRHLKHMEKKYQEYCKKRRNCLSGRHASKSQSLIFVQVSRPGLFRLDQVVDTSKTDSHILFPQEIFVAPCPRAEFLAPQSNQEEVHCAEEDGRQVLSINLYGVPPMSLRWSRSINGKREHFVASDLEGSGELSRDRKSPYNDPYRRDHYPSRERLDRRSPQQFGHELEIALDTPGDHLYTLDDISDGAGNVVHFSPMGAVFSTTDLTSGSRTKTSHSMVVLRKPMVSFRSCSLTNPTPLLVGHEALLTVAANASDVHDSSWEAVIKYEPPADSNISGRKTGPWERAIQPFGRRKEATLPAIAPGDYTIVHVKGKHCVGEPVEPKVCRVSERAKPTVDITWEVTKSYYGEKSLVVSLLFHGTAPFHLMYQVRRDKNTAAEIEKSFGSERATLTFEPDQSGHYVYTFRYLNDANYKKVDPRGPTITQDIGWQAAASFVHRRINSCDFGSVPVEVDLGGQPPWTVHVRVPGTGVLRFSDISKSRTTLPIPIPEFADKTRQPFEVMLVSVEDARGVKESLSKPKLQVHLQKDKPSVRFAGGLSERNITLMERSRTMMPLRLTGEAPWRLKYRRQELKELTLSATVTSPIGSIPVSEAGTYELLEVVDNKCSGTILSEASTFQVNWIPRPYVKLAADTVMTRDTYNESYILKPVCHNADDHVELDLIGKPPFQVSYKISRKGAAGPIEELFQPSYNSINHRTSLQLYTSQPGRVYYDIAHVGDANYPIAKFPPTEAIRTQYIKFEQEVGTQPFARFKSKSRLSYNVQDALVPFNRRSSDGVLELKGIPPFKVQISIRNMENKQVETLMTEVHSYTWQLEFPSYHFKAPGQHIVTIDAVVDGSNCGRALLSPKDNWIQVDVSALANITPLNGRTDFCEREVVEFDLDGQPPWVVGYNLHGQNFQREVYDRPFSLFLERPGELVITSITNRGIRKQLVPSLRYNIHALPSAMVAHGGELDQDITEGDQADITFTLIGEPPFTFVYKRSELGVNGEPGNVVETDRVSNINAHTHTIKAAHEGIWTVAFIADKYCEYPPRNGRMS
ncbi:hypothetical protein BDN72DRAFT_264822 [Pluteus cervinus]|uniref:Uncharacterized protein n=1 Tax=Pluteus cervinus TaxID=181527 RepID=A0ACD3AFW9_9AGAR|nr:hypothetical protein BDN72DRAFT_264822 [Pluteus cervinus]